MNGEGSAYTIDDTEARMRCLAKNTFVLEVKRTEKEYGLLKLSGLFRQKVNIVITN